MTYDYKWPVQNCVWPKEKADARPEPEPEPNALQDENDRLREDIAVLEGQVRDSVRKDWDEHRQHQKRLEKVAAQDALIKELREALTEACDWNWDAHYFEVANHFYGSEQVPAPICKQIFEALHRKV